MTLSKDLLDDSPQPGIRNLELKIEGVLYRVQGFGGRTLPRFLRRGVLKPDYFIRLGTRGPELVFPLNRSLSRLRKDHAELSEACEPTKALMPEIAWRTAGNSRRNGLVSPGTVSRLWNRCWMTLGTLLCAAAIVASYAGWEGREPKRDSQAVQLAAWRTAGVRDYLQIGHLVNRLIYSGAGVQNFAVRSAEKDFVEQEIGTLMKEFGAEEYSVPPEFVKEVNRFIKQFQDRDRDLISRALVNERQNMDRVREILRRDHLPEDLAYMALVESGFVQSSLSQEGAAGFWQFTESTAREYGMEVNEEVDDRMDLAKSTEAASRYIRDLILDFGTGSSVMLAMAAYNSGPEFVRRAVRNVKDPIKQRNFWYLYNTQALPAETREYVPKVFAAIIIGRNPERFGF